MKRLLPILALLLCASAHAAAPTIVQSASAYVTNLNSVSASFASNTTAGNFIFVGVGTATTSARTVNTPTMTGETFVKQTGASNGGTAGNGQVAIYTVSSAVGGQKTVTATLASGDVADIHLHIIEVSGQAASPIDATGNTESTTLSVSTSASTSTANDLVLMFMFDNSLNHTITAGTGYAQVQQTNNTGNGDVAFSESKTVSATGTQTATASGNAGDTCELGIIAIAGSGAAPSKPHQLTTLGAG